MNNILRQDTFITKTNQPFYNYNNGTYTPSTNSFSYTQRYDGSGNPLSSFLNEIERRINEYINNYFIGIPIKYEATNLKNDLMIFFNSFYNEFMRNKAIIDASSYYYGGETTGHLTFNSTMSIIETIYISGKTIQHEVNDPKINYSIINNGINSNRW